MQRDMRQSKSFGIFVSFFMKNPDTNKIDHNFAIDTAMNSVSRSDLIAAKYDLEKLLHGSYSDEHLTQIWLYYHPQFTYSGDTQREFMQEVYDTVLIALADKKRFYAVL